MAQIVFDKLNEILRLLQAGIDELDSELQKSSGQITKAALLRERDKQQGQYDEIERSLNRCRKIDKGEAAEGESEASPFRVRKGMYKDFAKLSTAAQALLANLGGGPTPILKLVDYLNEAGFKVHNKRRNIYIPVTGTHIRRMMANDVHEKSPRSDGFFYGTTYKTTRDNRELIALRNSDTDAPPLEVKGKGGKTYTESRHGSLNLSPALD